MLAGDVDLNAWYKPDIDKKILKKLSKRSDIKGAIDISLFILILSLSGYFSILTWGSFIHSSYYTLWEYFLLQNYKHPARN